MSQLSPLEHPVPRSDHSGPENPVAPVGSAAPIGPESAAAAGEPCGIGGWLILPVIGLVVSIGVSAHYLVTQLLPLFEPDTWSTLNHPDSPVYHPLWSTWVVGEAVFHVGLIGFCAALLYMMFTRRRRLPGMMMGFYAAVLAFAVGDCVVGNTVLSALPEAQQDPAVYQEMINAIVRSMVAAAIWIPYFRRSVRVKNTFVN